MPRRNTTLLLAVLLVVAACGPGALAGPISQGSQPESLQYSWNNVTIVAGGFITGIIPHPTLKNIMYVRTDIGGAYRYDGFTKKWAPLTDIFDATQWNLLGTESIAVDPVDPSRLYLAQGTYIESWAGNGAILRSTDFGFTFKRTDLPIKLGANDQGRFSGERLAVDPQHHNVLYFGSRQDGLWKSADFGETWNQVGTFPVTGPTNGVGIVFVTFHPTSQRPKRETIYVGVSDPTNGLYSSTDGGTTWQVVAGQPSGFRPNHYALSPDGTLYLTYGDGTGEDGMGGPRIGNGAVWKYDTNLGTWTNITPRGPWGTTTLWYGFGAAAVDRQNPNTVMVSTLGRWWPGDEIYRSLDAGATWVPLGSEPDTGLNFSLRDDSLSPYLNFGAGCTTTSCDPTRASFGWWIGTVAIDPFDSDHVLYGTGATIWESRDVTGVDLNPRLVTHWTVGANGIEETAVLSLISPPAGAHLVSGVADIGGFRHDDITVSPRAGMSLPDIGSVSIDFAENSPSIMARIGWATPEGAYSMDGGLSWTAFGTSPPGGPRTIAISSDGSRFVLAPNSGTPFYSLDHGATWTASTGLPPNDPVIADRSNPLKFYGFDAASGTVYASVDGAVTFKAAAAGLPNGGQLRATTFAEGDLWLATGNGVFHSVNSGASFVNIGTVVSADSVGFGKAARHQNYPTLFISGNVNSVVGIFRSTDGGSNWVRINDSRHEWGWNGNIIGDPRIFGRVYVSTNGRGIMYGDPEE
jgi:photosystem II stability/assembly factor-like uncharacterized protein